LIIEGTYDEFGKIRRMISIDNSDSKHPNRVLHISESIDVLGKTKYRIDAGWVSEKYAATMNIDRNDIIKLIESLKKIIE